MSKIPLKFQPFLPSSPLESLDTGLDKMYIIENFLKKANLSAWQWMLQVYAPEDIRQVVLTSKTLRPKDVYFWTHYLNIPKDQVLCLQTKSQNTLKSSWAY